jgi:hypothetical protein
MEQEVEGKLNAITAVTVTIVVTLLKQVYVVVVHKHSLNENVK